MRSAYTIMTALLAASSVMIGNAGAEDTRSVPVDQGFSTNVSAWFESGACDGGDGKFHFRVGEQELEIESGKIAQGRLRFITASKSKTGPIEVKLPSNAGCPKAPLALVEALIVADLKDLPKHVVLLETPDRTERTSPAAKYIEHLGSKGQCKTTGKTRLIACYGSHTVDGKSIPIVFVVLTQPDGHVHLPESGSPIYARCDQISDTLLCWIVAELDNKVTIKGSVELASLSAEVLQARYDALVQFATGISKK